MIKTTCDVCEQELPDGSGRAYGKSVYGIRIELTVKMAEGSHLKANPDLCDYCACYMLQHGEFPAQPMKQQDAAP